MDISSTTYLINDSEIEFSTEFQYIKSLRKDRKIRLQPMESRVLEVLCRYANQYVSKEKLLNMCWSTEVDEGSLTRVISLLRKYFKAMGTKGLIVNKPKCGYMLDSHVSIVEEANKFGQTRTKEYFEETSKLKMGPTLEGIHTTAWIQNYLLSKLAKIGLTSLIICVVIGVYYWGDTYSQLVLGSKTNSNSAVSIQFDNITPVFDEVGETQHQQLSISPSGNKIIYSKSYIHEENWGLEWLVSGSLSEFGYARRGVNLASPVWRDETSFVYHLYSDDVCEIRLATLVNEKVTQDNLLRRCNTQSLAKSLAWKDHEHLLFTDSDSIKKTHQLYELDVNTLMVTLLKIPGNYGRGIYGVFINDKRDKLALLVNDDWVSTDIEIYEVNNYLQRLNTFSVERTLFSVGWLNDASIVFQNKLGGLSVFDTSTQDKSTLVISLEGHFSNPVTAGGKLALLYEPYFVSNIYKLPLDGVNIEVPKPLNNFKRASQKVVARDRNEIYFVSDRTGKEQIYQYDETSKRLASNLKENLSINQLSFLSDKEVVLVSHSSGVNLYRYIDGQIKEVLHTWDNADRGCFFKDELYLVLVEGQVPDLYKADMFSGEVNSKITNSGADNCLVEGDNMYYTRYYADGIWSYVDGENDELIIDIAVSNAANSWFVFENYLWFVTPKERRLKKVDLSDVNKSPLDIHNNVVSIHKGSDTLYFTTIDQSPNQIHLLEFNQNAS